MPFKTRSQKMKAQKRRFIFAESGGFNYDQKGKTLRTENSQNAVIEKANPGRIELSYDYVRRDLWKITLIASLVIAVQLAIKLFI